MIYGLICGVHGFKYHIGQYVLALMIEDYKMNYYRATQNKSFHKNRGNQCPYIPHILQVLYGLSYILMSYSMVFGRCVFNYLDFPFIVSLGIKYYSHANCGLFIPNTYISVINSNTINSNSQINLNTIEILAVGWITIGLHRINLSIKT